MHSAYCSTIGEYIISCLTASSGGVFSPNQHRCRCSTWIHQRPKATPMDSPCNLNAWEVLQDYKYPSWGPYKNFTQTQWPVCMTNYNKRKKTNFESSLYPILSTWFLNTFKTWNPNHSRSKIGSGTLSGREPNQFIYSSNWWVFDELIIFLRSKQGANSSVPV